MKEEWETGSIAGSVGRGKGWCRERGNPSKPTTGKGFEKVVRWMYHPRDCRWKVLRQGFSMGVEGDSAVARTENEPEETKVGHLQENQAPRSVQCRL